MFARTVSYVSLTARNARLVRKQFFSAENKIAATSGENAVKKAEAPQAVVTKGGSSFFQRFASFLTGCGVGFGMSYYFLLQDLEESNQKLAQEIAKIQSQLKQ